MRIGTSTNGHGFSSIEHEAVDSSARLVSAFNFEDYQYFPTACSFVGLQCPPNAIFTHSSSLSVAVCLPFGRNSESFNAILLKDSSMNLLTMLALAVFAPGAGADTENADVWDRGTSDHVENSATHEDAEAMQKKSGAGILVQCKSLKIKYTAEVKVIECEGCTFYTSKGKNGLAHSAVYDQVKGILTLTGEETTYGQWTIEKNENGEQRIVSQSMQITIPNGKPAVSVPDSMEIQRQQLEARAHNLRHKELLQTKMKKALLQKAQEDVLIQQLQKETRDALQEADIEPVFVPDSAP
jgi:hypothetical protein